MCRKSKSFLISILVVFLFILGSFVSESTSAFASMPGANQVVPSKGREDVFTWVPAGALTDGRHAHTATLLSDGRVLIDRGHLRGHRR